MKNALILLTSIICLNSCQKSSTNHTKNYFCTRNDSVSSNIPVYNNAHYKTSSGNYNQYSEAQYLFLLKTMTYTDTMLYRHDTLVLEHWTINCNEID